ncbi:MAG TPA: glutamate--tRNA ligase [Anaerolineae bacterium]|nr:glutamate--tRNA ligase [Anaerolineae bacterium]
MTKQKPARVRFAPSPTGMTHLGSARTALYNYLLAHQTNGQFILRIEDTDRKRYNPESEIDLISSLKWLGLNWDEGPDIGGPYAPYRQSERKDIYQSYAQKLIDMGYAYPCFCTQNRLNELRKEQQKRKVNPKYDRKCRDIPPLEAAKRVANGESHVIRFKTPLTGSITVHDYLRGDITVNNKQLDDFIIVKSDGLALYHLAAMVDDHLMGITHVFRGEEWLSTFPFHAHIYRAFGWEEPVWIHLSVFLNPTGKGKMSKRFAQQMRLKGNSIFIKDIRKMGYIPEGVINWIVLMGWSFDDKTEFFTLNDLVNNFSIDKLNPSPAAIDFKKLDYFDGLHIRALSKSELAKRLKPFYLKAGYSIDDSVLDKVIPLIQVRLHTLNEAPEISGFFFADHVNPNPNDLIGKHLTIDESIIAAHESYKLLSDLTEFSPSSLEQPLRQLAEKLGLKAGQLFGILRVAITGQKVSPPLLESMEIIGKETVLNRITIAIDLLKSIEGQPNQS